MLARLVVRVEDDTPLLLAVLVAVALGRIAGGFEATARFTELIVPR